MKKYLLLLALCIFAQQSSCAQTSTEQWRDDLQFLKHTVHTKYPNLFHNVTAKQFDSAVTALDERLPQLKEYECIAEMSRIVAMFRIGHTRITLTPMQLHQAGAKQQTTFNRIPVQLYWFSDGLYVKAAEKKYMQSVGGRVLKIGTMETAKALEEVRPYTVYENEKGFESNVPNVLIIPEILKSARIIETLDNIPMVIAKNGKEERIVFEVSASKQPFFSMTGNTIPDDWVDARPIANPPLWLREPNSYRFMEYLKDSRTLYVRHSVTMDDGTNMIEKFFTTMADFIDKNDVDKLILDVRMNSGGNNYLNKPIITNIIAARKINQKSKFFCIIGRRTFSACQNLVNELEKYTEVTFVGEPTSENVNFYGDTKKEVLPNSKLTVSLSWLWWQNQDPRDKRLWTAPHIATDMSFADYVANQDPAISAILNTPQASSPLGATLRQMAIEGKSEEALKWAAAYKNNPQHRYYADRIENDVNEIGYQLMNKGELKAANTLFTINVQLYAESANAYDSMGECLLKLGKKDEAISAYNLAITKDAPNGETAKNAKKMIAQIQGGTK